MATDTTTPPIEGEMPSVIDPEMEAMLEAGVHLGHRRSKRHPAMAPYVWGVRNNVEIIDLTKTKEKLAEALAFLKKAGEEKQLLLFVGTRPSAKELLRRTASELGYPYVDQRWIGGTLTNFKVVLKRIETLEALEQEKAAGGFEKYTKKEQLGKEEEIMRLTGRFDGLRRLRRLPDALVIIGLDHETTALREAKRMRISVVAPTDTNTDPKSVEYPIPANDDARSAIAYLLTRMRTAIREGQQAGEQAVETPPAEALVSQPVR